MGQKLQAIAQNESTYENPFDVERWEVAKHDHSCRNHGYLLERGTQLCPADLFAREGDILHTKS